MVVKKLTAVSKAMQGLWLSHGATGYVSHYDGL